MATVRSGGIRGFADVVRGLGADPEPFVRATGLDVAVLDHDDVPIAERRLAGLLELAARELDCPDLGLRMAARHGLDTLGPLAVMLANCRTGADVLAATGRYLTVHSDAVHVDWVDDPEGERGIAGLRYRGELPGPPPVQAMDAGLGFVHRALTLLFGDDYGLVGVHLSYRPAGEHHAFYRVPLVKRSETVLRINQDLLEKPVKGAQARLRINAETHLRTLMTEGDGLTCRIRAAVDELLVFGAAPMDAVARTLAMHPRTVQRRLAEQGTTYAHLVDNIRRDRARHYLTETSLPFRDVSALLGFAEQATFSRACHRWWGVPPRRVRPARELSARIKFSG